MLEALKNIFEKVANNFYNEDLMIELSNESSTAYYDMETSVITLSIPLLEKFTAAQLPRFTVFYHELGHALFTKSLHSLINKWKNIPISKHPLMYQDKYFHLLNWIEDFYIEDKLKTQYPYLTDIVNCLKLCPVDYDETELPYTFNYFYRHQCASPALSTADGLVFKSFIMDLLSYRSSYNFGKGPLSLLSNKTKETMFIHKLLDFHQWCVQKGILIDTDLPPLSNPNNIVKPQPSTNQVGNNPQTNNGNNGQTNNSQTTTQNTSDSTDDESTGGTSSDHSHLVGVSYVEDIPVFTPEDAEIFVEQFVAENKLIKQEIIARTKVETKNASLDGLFASTCEDSSIISNKIITPNFFNPNRLVDQILFKQPKKAYNAVSIYRDISGSTECRSRFPLINEVCKYLFKHIPITPHFYLYCSGDISITEINFEDWEDWKVPPETYEMDLVFQQFTGGTNSGAVADVITEQLNDKWLNIIVTDGDLYDLMRRDNITSLLENVFVIAIGEDSSENRRIINPDRYIFVEDETELPLIIDKLANIRGDF